jgi:SAM-dependent MidA family methyltransferase
MMTTDILREHEQEHGERVLTRLRERITAAGGWIPFDEYMRIALYEPGLGYYSAGARKFGAGGDFTTAPEISPLFGQLLAVQCAQVLEETGGDILEPGAGTGALAVQLLSALEARGCAPYRYRILETSAELRQRQQALIATLPAALAARVEWLDVPPAAPWRGALIANEVLDALPVECFAWRSAPPDSRGADQQETSAWQAVAARDPASSGSLVARGVGLDAAGQLCWCDGPANAALLDEVVRIRTELPQPWPVDYESELCLRAGPWIAALTQHLTRGVALFIDYGLPRREYYHPSRIAGTLRCHHRQFAHEDPFAHPGLEDITAWVDFTRIAEASDIAGLDVLGYTTQAGLLLSLGLEAAVAASPDEPTRLRRASEARQLVMPTEMGETFKALALGRDFHTPLRGFALQDLRSKL